MADRMGQILATGMALSSICGGYVINLVMEGVNSSTVKQRILSGAS